MRAKQLLPQLPVSIWFPSLYTTESCISSRSIVSWIKPYCFQSWGNNFRKRRRSSLVIGLRSMVSSALPRVAFCNKGKVVKWNTNVFFCILNQIYGISWTRRRDSVQILRRNLKVSVALLTCYLLTLLWECFCLVLTIVLLRNKRVLFLFSKWLDLVPYSEEVIWYWYQGSHSILREKDGEYHLKPCTSTPPEDLCRLRKVEALMV